MGRHKKIFTDNYKSSKKLNNKANNHSDDSIFYGENKENTLLLNSFSSSSTAYTDNEYDSHAASLELFEQLEEKKSFDSISTVSTTLSSPSVSPFPQSHSISTPLPSSSLNSSTTSSNSTSSSSTASNITNSNSSSSCQKIGKWTAEEEQEARELIEKFTNGSLQDCEEGATLRSYLAKRLNCAPMRISKKFAGLCIGKSVYSHKGSSMYIKKMNFSSSKKKNGDQISSSTKKINREHQLYLLPLTLQEKHKDIFRELQNQAQAQVQTQAQSQGVQKEKNQTYSKGINQKKSYNNISFPLSTISANNMKNLSYSYDSLTDHESSPVTSSLNSPLSLSLPHPSSNFSSVNCPSTNVHSNTSTSASVHLSYPSYGVQSPSLVTSDLRDYPSLPSISQKLPSFTNPSTYPSSKTYQNVSYPVFTNNLSTNTTSTSSYNPNNSIYNFPNKDCINDLNLKEMFNDNVYDDFFCDNQNDLSLYIDEGEISYDQEKWINLF